MYYAIAGMGRCNYKYTHFFLFCNLEGLFGPNSLFFFLWSVPDAARGILLFRPAKLRVGFAPSSPPLRPFLYTSYILLI